MISDEHWRKYSLYWKRTSYHFQKRSRQGRGTRGKLYLVSRCKRLHFFWKNSLSCVTLNNATGVSFDIVALFDIILMMLISIHVQTHAQVHTECTRSETYTSTNRSSAFNLLIIPRRLLFWAATLSHHRTTTCVHMGHLGKFGVC